MGVPICRLHLKEAIPNVQNRNIERAPAQIIHRNLLILLLVQSIGQRSGRRLVDDAENLKPSNLARILGCLTLTVVEVSRHGNHRLRNFFT